MDKDKDKTADQAPPVLHPDNDVRPTLKINSTGQDGQFVGVLHTQQSVEVSNSLIEHSQGVERLLLCIANALTSRAMNHDRSKFDNEEFPTFVVETPKLKDLVYGSVEYKEALVRMAPALKHHYEKNSHHPEHFAEGIRGMDLIDLVEMLCDWAASVHRQKDGNLASSIVLNQDRFNISDDLTQIFLNTITFFEEFGLCQSS